MFCWLLRDSRPTTRKCSRCVCCSSMLLFQNGRRLSSQQQVASQWCRRIHSFSNYLQCGTSSNGCQVTQIHMHAHAQCACRIQHPIVTLLHNLRLQTPMQARIFFEAGIRLIRDTAGYLLQLVETEMSKPHRIRDSTQQGLVNVMWSFATLRYYPTKYFSAVVPHLEVLLPGFNDQELSNCLWAFGRLAHHPGKLVGVFCESLDRQVSFCNTCNAMSQRLAA